MKILAAGILVLLSGCGIGLGLDGACDFRECTGLTSCEPRCQEYKGSVAASTLQATCKGIGGKSINGYTYGDMVAYSLLVMLGRAFSSMPLCALSSAGSIPHCPARHSPPLR